MGDALAERLDRIEHLLEQVLSESKRRKRRGGKRAATVAQRAALSVESQPTELQRARARRALARRGSK